MTTPSGPPAAPPPGDAPGALVPAPAPATEGGADIGAETLETERVGTPTTKPPRLAAVPMAWGVALLTDLVQWVVFPFFVSPLGWPVDAVLDVVTAGILIRLLGWHWAFLPGFLMELIPGVDMVPTWTVAVFLATRGRKRP